jgi:hypothetical protein
LLSFVRSVFPPIDGTGERDLSADGDRLQRALGAAARSGELPVLDADHGSAAALPGDS